MSNMLTRLRRGAGIATLLMGVILINGCTPGSTFLPAPTPTVRPRTRQPATATSTPEDTATPTADPPTETATTTATAIPPTATFTTQPPTATATRRPPTSTPRPTATVTPAPPTNTPTPAFALTFNWINTGRPYDANECNSFPQGTHVQGMMRHSDGSLITGAIHTAWMHLWINGQDSGPFARPGVPKEFPTWNDGRWDADFPKWPKDFEWHIDITPKSTDQIISADLTATASAVGSCGQPGTRNFFIADWISH
jgi:hypothetical protein